MQYFKIKIDCLPTAFVAAFVAIIVINITKPMPYQDPPIIPLWCRDFQSCALRSLEKEDLHGIPADYLLSMALLETGNGTGDIYEQTNNLFSIKAENGYIGKTYFSASSYRVYSTNSESIRDVVRLLSMRSRYRKAYRYAITDERKKFFKELQRVGYSEDENYAKKLEKQFQRIQRRKSLTRFAQLKVLASGRNYNFAN